MAPHTYTLLKTIARLLKGIIGAFDDWVDAAHAGHPPTKGSIPAK